MKTTVEKQGGNMVLLHVEVPAEDSDKAIERTYKAVAGQVNIPGFRKGKVPKAILDSHIGREAILAQAVQEYLPKVYPEAVDASGIRPIEQPEIDIIQFEQGKPFKFKAKVEVKPEAELENYKDHTLYVPSSEVKEEDVDAQIEELRDRFATLEVVEGRPVEEGDFVLVDSVGTIDDKPFGVGTVTDFMVEVGAEKLLPEIEEALIGAEKGQTLEVESTVPDDFHQEALRGKKAKYQVTIKEIKVKILPELTDDFVAESSPYETVEELREELRKQIAAGKKRGVQLSAHQEMLKILVEQVKVDIPERLIKGKQTELKASFLSMLKGQGLTPEEYHRITESGQDQLDESLRAEAERQLKEEFALEAIGRREGIEATEEDVDKRVEELAGRARITIEEFKERLGETGIEMIREQVEREKILDWLLEQNKVVEDDSKAARTGEDAAGEAGEDAEAKDEGNDETE